MKRIKEWEYASWGDCVLEGRYIHESQQNFRGFAANRDVAEIEKRVGKYSCPVIGIDSIEDWRINITKIVMQYQRIFLYHYFEKTKGPLLSLSALAKDEADAIQNRLVADNETFAVQRNERYLPRSKELDLSTVSFTYGDTFPTFSPNATDGMEYRNTVYTYDEVLEIIDKYGLP